MEGYIYILICGEGRYYLGSTKDLKKRICLHERGRVRSTRNLLPVKIVFYKRYKNIKMARKIEYKLKKFKSKKIIDKIIADKDIKTT